MFTPKNRDRLPEVVRDEVDNIQAQISTTFLKEHDNQGRHVFPAGDVVPVGACVLWFSDTAPNSKWLFCRGQQLSRTTYAALFNIIGTQYGAGDLSTTFNAPDLQQRFPLGKAASGTGNALAGTGGAIDHTHTGPSHTHTGPSHTHSISSSGTHTHSINDHSHSISSDGTHDHGGNTGVQSADYQVQAGTSRFIADAPHTHTISSGGSHNHGGATDTTSISANAGGDHDHGAVTGASGTGNTGASGTGNTGTANPPYLVVNYIIFSGVEVN